MKCVTVVNVKGMAPADREKICYCGRSMRGGVWKDQGYGNKNYLDCPGEFQKVLLGWPELEPFLAKLWKDCLYGAKPLGCWCVNWNGEGKEIPGCHAAVYASELNKRVKEGILTYPNVTSSMARIEECVQKELEHAGPIGSVFLKQHLRMLVDKLDGVISES